MPHTEDEIVVRRVDHIMIRLEEPILSHLFSLLTETFELPIAWTRSSYETFSSSGIFAGNVNIELCQFGTQGNEDGVQNGQARLYGVAFEPIPLNECFSRLKERGIAYLPPMPSTRTLEEGEKITLWTNVILGRLLGNSPWTQTLFLLGRAVPEQLWQRATKTGGNAHNTLSASMLDKLFANGMIFLCEYNPEFHDAISNRAANGAVLHARRGGPLGLEAVTEILIGVSNFPDAVARWQNLLEPHPVQRPGLWTVGNGPDIHLMPYEQDTLLGLVWKVTSREQALRFLKENNLLGQVHARYLTIAPEKVYGLDIRLVE